MSPIVSDTVTSIVLRPLLLNIITHIVITSNHYSTPKRIKSALENKSWQRVKSHDQVPR